MLKVGIKSIRIRLEVMNNTWLGAKFVTIKPFQYCLRCIYCLKYRFSVDVGSLVIVRPIVIIVSRVISSIALFIFRFALAHSEDEVEK